MPPQDALVDGEFITADGEAFELVAADGYERAGLELLEVDDAIVDEIVSGDGVVRFKGGPDDVAVVCTKSKTYQVKRVETSNQLLIVGPPLRGEEEEEGEDAEEDGGETEAAGKKRATVRAEMNSHLDLTEIAPKLDRLREMMRARRTVVRMRWRRGRATAAAAAAAGSISKSWTNACRRARRKSWRV